MNSRESHGLFALEAQLHRIKGQHPVDGEVRTDLLEHFDIAEPAQPIVIVHHHRIGRPVAERQQPFEHGPDAGDVRLNCFVGQHLAALVAPRGVADPRGAATHQDDRLVPGLLEPTQQHDLHQATDMKAGRSGVEADIAPHHLPCGKGVQTRRIRDLVDISARLHHAEQLGLVLAHKAPWNLGAR